MSVILGKVTFFHCPWVWNSEYHFFKATLELRLSTQWQTVTTASKNLQVTVHEDLPLSSPDGSPGPQSMWFMPHSLSAACPEDN